MLRMIVWFEDTRREWRIAWISRLDDKAVWSCGAIDELTARATARMLQELRA